MPQVDYLRNRYANEINLQLKTGAKEGEGKCQRRKARENSGQGGRARENSGEGRRGKTVLREGEGKRRREREGKGNSDEGEITFGILRVSAPATETRLNGGEGGRGSSACEPNGPKVKSRLENSTPT
ncbi:hypothetical protein ACOSQ2_016564 [Xanthoceras sorbifolium]